MNRFLTNIISLFTIAIISMTLYSCGSSDNGDKKEKKMAETVAPADFTAIIPQQGGISSSIHIPGELQAFQQVDLYAKVSSFVKKLYVDVGSEVQTGQLLATLDAPEITAQQNAALSKLKSQEAIYIASKATYNRLLKTSKTPGTVSPNDLEQADAKQQSDFSQLEAAKAAYREVTDTKSYLEIRAPFNGIITARNISAGAYVGPTGKGSDQPMFTLEEQKKLRLVVSIPEAYSESLNKNGKIEFTVRSIPKDTFTAKIARAAGALDNRLRSQRIEMDVINNDKKLLPGMVAEIIVPLQSNNRAITVPSSAVLNSTLGVFVIRVENKKAHWISVTTGATNADVVEVIGQLSAQDTIIKKASEEIRNGQEVNVQLEN